MQARPRKTAVVGIAASALGGALVLLVLWTLHPAAGSPQTPRPSTPQEPAPGETPLAGRGTQESRFPGGQGPASPSARAAGSTGTPLASPPPGPRVGPPGGHLDRLRYLQGISGGQGEAGGQEAIRRTAAHLSIDAARVSEFEIAARESVLEMEQALDVRKRELSASLPGGGSSGPSEQERLSQERYAAARAKALERLDRFLAQNSVHQEFRWEFDSWASMVAQKARVLDR